MARKNKAKLEEKERQERVTRFSNAMQDMIAKDIGAYKSIYSSQRANLPTEYTKEQVVEILRNGEPNELKELSRTFFYLSGFYRMLILYYACFLDYSLLTIPKFKDDKKPSTNIKNSYHKAIKYVENFKAKDLFVRFAIKVLVDGAYYGMISRKGDIANIVDLPFEFCRSRFKNYQGIDVVEFNLSYFDSIPNIQKRTACLKTFPDEVRQAYNTYKNRQGSQWFLVQPENGVHFAFFEERPLFSDIIPAVMDFAEYRELEKEKDKQDLYKILVQEMPHLNDGELVFEPEEVAEMHKGISQMIKSRNGIDFVTSFGTMKVADMQANRSVISNNLDKISSSIYAESGVSKEIFSADNSTALSQSLKKDMSIAMHLGNKFARWLQFIVNNDFAKQNDTSFSITLLPITFYNRDEIFKNSFQGIQYGYSILVPFLALGINQGDVYDLKVLETDILKLDKVMKPLESANTRAANEQGNAKTSEQGREDAAAKGKTLDNEKTTEQRAEQTIKNRESGGQTNE